MSILSDVMRWKFWLLLIITFCSLGVTFYLINGRQAKVVLFKSLTSKNLLSGNSDSKYNIRIRNKADSKGNLETATSNKGGNWTYMKKLKSVPKGRKKMPQCSEGSPRISIKSLEKYKSNMPPDITVITAFFNIGMFSKGTDLYFGPNTYKKWSRVYKYLQNPLVFYTDSEDFKNHFIKMRAKLSNVTKVIMVKRTSLWSFSWIETIRKIYSNPRYPKHHPNTVIPEYSCAQHSKYACVDDTIIKNYFQTKYVTWLDIGYFRYIVNRKRHFRIITPRNFDENKIAVNKVFSVSMTTIPETIFKNNKVWIGGGMFLGKRSVVRVFIKDYRRAVNRYLNMSLSNTDQQVLFAMNTVEEKNVIKPQVELQVYTSDVAGDCWFYLGYSCYREIKV